MFRLPNKTVQLGFTVWTWIGTQELVPTSYAQDCNEHRAVDKKTGQMYINATKPIVASLFGFVTPPLSHLYNRRGCNYTRLKYSADTHLDSECACAEGISSTSDYSFGNGCLIVPSMPNRV